MTELHVFLYINAMLTRICSEFDNIQILYEKEISESHITASGRFELVIKKGKSVLCLLEAKEDLIRVGHNAWLDVKQFLTVRSVTMFME